MEKTKSFGPSGKKTKQKNTNKTRGNDYEFKALKLPNIFHFTIKRFYQIIPIHTYIHTWSWLLLFFSQIFLKKIYHWSITDKIHTLFKLHNTFYWRYFTKCALTIYPIRARVLFAFKTTITSQYEFLACTPPSWPRLLSYNHICQYIFSCNFWNMHKRRVESFSKTVIFGKTFN